MRRWALALIIGSATPILTAQDSPQITIDLSEHGAAARDRIDAAARLATASYAEWLGPAPFKQLLISDPRVDGKFYEPPDVMVQVPLWDSPGTMAIESQVAEGIARAWLAGTAANDAWQSGAASYLQSRIVEQLFDRRYLLKAYRYDGVCWFGCHVPWSFRPLPLSRWTAVTDRVALTFASLERELGWPTLQGALRAAASGAAPDPIAAMGAATGRDLAPVFAEASRGGPIDRTIRFSWDAGSCASPCYRTLVSIAPAGDEPLPFLVRVSFSDGTSIDARWDGSRAQLEFESAAKAIGAELDPDRVWLLDRNPLNNARVPARETNVPVTKWMARWIVWLQDAMLTHTFPV